MKCITERNPKLEIEKRLTLEDFKKGCKEVYGRSRKTIGYNEITVDLGDDDAGIKLDCDWHIGNEMTRLDLWADDIQTTLETKRCFTLLGGDYTDNLEAIKKQAGTYESILTVPEAKQKVSNAVSLMKDKIIGVVQGCFLEGTPIVADDYTMKPIETISLVLGSKKPQQVKFHWLNNYTKDGIYRISYLGNTVFDIPATGDHPFIAIERIKNKHAKEHKIIPKTIKAKDLNVGDFVYIPKPEEPKGNKFTMEDMKIFGWYLAEGSVLPEKSMTVFSFGIKELNVAFKLQKTIESNHSTKISSTHINIRKDRNSCVLCVYGSDFANWIYKNCGRYSHSKKLHIDVICESNKKLAELVDCFRLGDGHTRNNNGLDITLTTISKDLAWQLWHILLRIGEFASIRQAKRKNRNYDDFQINYKPNRKQFRFIETKEGYYVPITKIEFQEYQGEVKNLWIDSNEHVYRVGGILVGNCHDEWFFQQDSWDISQYLADHSKGYWLGFRGIVNVVLGEQTYRICIRHKYRRHSTDNLLWGMLYKFRKLKDPVDIMMGGHHHHPDMRTAYERGQKIYMFMGGSYKPYDRFTEHKDIDESPAYMPLALLRSDKHQIIPFLDFNEAIDYL